MIRWKKNWAIVLASVICFSSVHITTVNAKQQEGTMLETQACDLETVSGNVMGVNKEKGIEESIPTEAVWKAEDYEVAFTLSGFWNGGYTADITIQNNGEVPIENWYLKLEFGDEIANIWNASICESEGGMIVIKNDEWNQNIPAGDSVQFGFCAANDFCTFPEKYELISASEEVLEEDYIIDYCVDSEWENGFNGRILITNNAEYVIEDWLLTFDFKRNISNIWGANIEAVDKGKYTVKNAGYNANIGAGETVSFGFTGNEGINSDNPLNFCLYTYGLYDVAPEKPGIGEESGETDTDGDGLTDECEIEWGLNHENADSDGDGLSDYAEIYLTGTDPLIVDTDQNGVSDAEEDLDRDGLSNNIEMEYGTNPASSDTDGDNLTDYDEVYVYDTNPQKEDTDGDGLSDYDDVYLGFNPLLTDTDGNGISDANEKVRQTVEKGFEGDEGRGLSKVSVSLNVFGNAQDSVEIINMYNVDTLSSTVVGLVGVPVEINANAEFETAELTFYYDDALLGDVKEENLSILWYDEANNWYQILDKDCVVDTVNNTISYVTSHFSTYMLVDSKAWYDAWRENIDYRNSSEGDEKHCFDIAFVVDASGSMSGRKISSVKSALTNFVNAMQSGDEAGIISFCHTSSEVCDFTDNATALKKGIDGLYAEGGTDVNQGLLNALSLFEGRENDRQKLIVLMCDGDINYVQSTIDSCVEQKIQIDTIGITGYAQGSPLWIPMDSEGEKCLQKISNLTGGQYYYERPGNLLDDIFVSIQGNTVNQINPTDTDGDGLYDIYERAGMKLPNGRIVYTDPNKADTDGDGLSDFEETGIIYNVDDRYLGFGMLTMSRQYFMLRSDPTCVDTDADGIRDDTDMRPWHKEEEWTAVLDNRYPNVEYLKIQRNDGALFVGGNQGWWQDKTPLTNASNYWDFATDKYFRLWKMGCGVIAMSDVELYLLQQNPEYKLASQEIVPYDKSTGIMQENDYRNYVELNYAIPYHISGSILSYHTGLQPCDMENGIERFLQVNGSECGSARWAPYCLQGKKEQKNSVLNKIEDMLDKNIPVVFSYYSMEKDNNIRMYHLLEAAKEKSTDKSDYQDTNGHYMTIIGLYKYLDGSTSGDALSHYEYILKVVSWGEIYYIRYDRYADSLNYFSNILEVY